MQNHSTDKASVKHSAYDTRDTPSNSSPVNDLGASPSAEAETVAILLCTRNGMPFLQAQLESISAQTHVHWRITVSDDGSTDGTLALLRQFAERPENLGRADIRSGPRRGFVANFLSLATDVTIDADYFAYCDQDDIWHPEKLKRALHWLSSVTANNPALYCSRTVLLNSEGHRIGFSPLFRRPPSFRNAMVQNLGGGNTMVLNRAARELLIAGCPCDPVSHDWWCYLLVAGAGGTVYYDSHPSLGYRQHLGNQIGSDRRMAAHWKRFCRVMRGGWIAWNQRNEIALSRNSSLLTAENRELLELFKLMRYGSLVQRLLAWRRAALYRQTTFGQLSLLLAILLRKF